MNAVPEPSRDLLPHERRLAAVAHGQEYFEAQEGAVRMEALVQSGLILSAAHEGGNGALERSALEATCSAMVDTPPQEAADHAAVCAMARLFKPTHSRPVAGIVSPSNAHPALALCQRLTRSINQAYIERHGPPLDWNFFDRPFTAEWLKLERSEKLARLRTILTLFCAQNRLTNNDLKIADIDRFERINMMIGDGIEIARKPKILLDLESLMRQETGERLELFLVEMKDLNRIRRL